MNGNWVGYRNGNYDVLLNLDDGTKIRRTDDDFFKASMPESMDVKISNRCHHSCPFCHEDSHPDGKLCDLDLAAAVVSTMHPYTEIAVGGGNLMEDPDHTEKFLRMLVKRKCVPSITLRQEDFLNNLDIVRRWRDEALVYGIGVSLSNSHDPRLVDAMLSFPTSVLHVIAGVFSKEDVDALSNKGIKILILGYKDIRRGVAYRAGNGDKIDTNMSWLSSNIKEVMDSFAVVSFDNLALEQLPVRKTVGEKAWEMFYMGDDGTATFYIDLVEGEYARSSTSKKRHSVLFEKDGKEMLNTVSGMFAVIQAEYYEEACDD